MDILVLFKKQEEKFNKIIDYFSKNSNAKFDNFQSEFKNYEREFINAEYRYRIIEIVKKIYNENKNLVDLKDLIDNYDNGMITLKNKLLDNLKNSTYKKDIEDNNKKLFDLFAKILYPNISVNLLSKEQRDKILSKISNPIDVILLLERCNNNLEYIKNCLEIYILYLQNVLYEELIKIEDNILHQIYFEIDKTPVDSINLQIFIEVLNESLNAYKELQNNQEINISYKDHGLQKKRTLPYEIPEAKFFHLVGLPSCDFNGGNSNILGEFVKIYYELLKNNPNFIYNNDIANVEILSQLINDYGFELLSSIYNGMNIWFDNGDIYSNAKTKLILSENDPKIDSSHNIECDATLSEFLINLLVDENGNKVIVNGASIDDIQKAWKQKRDEFINLYAPKSMAKSRQNLGKSLEKCIRYRHISQFSNLKKIVLDYSAPTSKGWGDGFISFTKALTPKSPKKILYFDFSFITPLNPSEKRLFIEETIKIENGEKKILIPNFNPMYRNFLKEIRDQFGCKTFDDLYSLSVITPKDPTNNRIFDENDNPNFDISKIDVSFVLELCKKFNYRTFDDLSAFPIAICEVDEKSNVIAFKQLYSADFGAVVFSNLMSIPNNHKTFVKLFTDADDRNKKIKEILSSKNLSKLLAEYFAVCVDFLVKSGEIDFQLFKIIDQLCRFKNNFKKDDFENYNELCRSSEYFAECYNKKIQDLRSGKSQGKINYYLLGYKYVDPLLLKKLLGSELPIIYNSDQQYNYSGEYQSIRSDLPISTLLLDYDEKDLKKKISEEQKYAFRAFLLLAYTIAHEVLKKEVEIKGSGALSEFKDKYIIDNLPEPFKNILDNIYKQNLTQIDFLEFEKMSMYSEIDIFDKKAPRYISYESLYEMVKLFIFLEIKLNSNDLEKISETIAGKPKTHLFASNNLIINRIRETLELDDLRIIGKKFIGRDLYVYNYLAEIRDNLPISLLIPISRMLQESDSKMKSKTFEEEVAAFCYSEDVPLADDYGIETKESYELYVKSFMNKSFTEMLYDIITNGYDYNIDSISYMSSGYMVISRLHNIFNKTKEYNLNYDIEFLKIIKELLEQGCSLDDVQSELFDSVFNSISEEIHSKSFDIIYDKISGKIPSNMQSYFYKYFSCVYDLHINYSKSNYEAYENSLRELEQKISNDAYLIKILDECTNLLYIYMNDLYNYENIGEFRVLSDEYIAKLTNDEEFGDDNITPDDDFGRNL